MAAEKDGAQQQGLNSWQNIWLIFHRVPRYSADYHDIRRITMIFVPGLATE